MLKIEEFKEESRLDEDYPEYVMEISDEDESAMMKAIKEAIKNGHTVVIRPTK